MEAHFQSELFLTSSDLPNLSLVIYLFHHGHHGHHGQPRWDLLLWFAAMRPGHWATWGCVATKFGRTSLAGATDAGTGRMHRFQLMDGVSVRGDLGKIQKWWKSLKRPTKRGRHEIEGWKGSRIFWERWHYWSWSWRRPGSKRIEASPIILV